MYPIKIPGSATHGSSDRKVGVMFGLNLPCIEVVASGQFALILLRETFASSKGPSDSPRPDLPDSYSQIGKKYTLPVSRSLVRQWPALSLGSQPNNQNAE